MPKVVTIDGVFVSVFHAETDEQEEMTPAWVARLRAYMEHWRGEAGGNNPVGQHPVGDYIYDFSRRGSG